MPATFLTLIHGVLEVSVNLDGRASCGSRPTWRATVSDWVGLVSVIPHLINVFASNPPATIPSASAARAREFADQFLSATDCLQRASPQLHPRLTAQRSGSIERAHGSWRS